MAFSLENASLGHYIFCKKKNSCLCPWEGMPPVFLYAGTDETMYPEIMDTAENMRKAGVSVGVLVGKHLFHVAPLHPIPAADQYFEEITAFLYGKR